MESHAPPRYSDDVPRKGNGPANAPLLAGHYADMPDNDDEIEDFKFGSTVSQCAIEIRQAFIRKVYSILFIQLSATTAIGAMLSSSVSAKAYVQSNSWTFWVPMVGSICSMIALFAMRQRYPANVGLLSLFTVFESFAIGGIVTFFDQRIVLQALVITSFVFIGLTLFAMQTKYDLSSLQGFLYMGLISFLFVGLLQIFFPFGRTMDAIYAGVGTLLFSGYILYDTSLITHRLSPDEWVLAVVSLYLDVINLFLNILRLLNDTSEN